MNMTKESIKVARPSILKPVKPPKRMDGSVTSGREDGYTSCGAGSNIFNAGYLSQGGG